MIPKTARVTADSRSLAGRAPVPASLGRDLGLLLLLQLCFGYAFSTFFLLPKFVATELGGGAADIGLVGATTVLFTVISSPYSGRLLDRGPRTPLLTTGAALLTVSAVACLAVRELGPLLFITRALHGVAATLFFNAIVTLVADLAPPARLGQSLGWLGSAGLVMNAVATIAAEYGARRFGWSAVFGAAAVAGALATLLSLRVREPATALVTPAPLVTSIAPAPSSSRSLVYAAAAFGGGGFGALFTFSQPLALSIGERHVSALFAGYTAAALAVRLGFGSAADRFGRRKVSAFALAFYGAVLTATAFLRPGQLVYVGLGFGVAHGAFYPSLNALALGDCPRRARGSVAARFNAAFNVGVAIVTFGGGYLAASSGYPAVFGLVAALAFAGAGMLFGTGRAEPRSVAEPAVVSGK